MRWLMVPLLARVSDFLRKYLQFVMVGVFAVAMSAGVYWLTADMAMPMLGLGAAIILGLAAMAFVGITINLFNEKMNQRWHEWLEKKARQDAETVPVKTKKVVAGKYRKIKKPVADGDALPENEIDRRIQEFNERHKK